MAIALTPNPANFNTVTVVVPQDGIDFRTAASLYVAFQRLTDNDAFIGVNFLYKNVGTFALAQALSFTGFGVTLSNGCQVNNALGVAGGIVYAGGMLGDNAIFSGNVQLQTASVESVLSFSGAGHAVPRLVPMPDTANATIGINGGDVFYWPVLTQTCAVTLSTVGATNGCRLTLVCDDTTHGVNSADYLGIPRSVNNTGASQWRSITYIYHASYGWIVENYSLSKP